MELICWQNFFCSVSPSESQAVEVGGAGGLQPDDVPLKGTYASTRPCGRLAQLQCVASPHESEPRMHESEPRMHGSEAR